MSATKSFLDRVAATYSTGVATEHSYRSAIEALFLDIDKCAVAINEPKRVACGAPDFIVQRDDIVVGHVEAKDLNIELSGLTGANKKQQQRYTKALTNLIYTNCHDWQFYRNGGLAASISIASVDGKLHPKPEAFEKFESLMREFVRQVPQSITQPRDLAERMAAKSLLIRDVLCSALLHDSKGEVGELFAQFKAFRTYLIHNIEIEEFAEIYAETIAYGMFAARLRDPTPETFSRQEALTLLPKSNPFLRNLFSYLAGVNLDDRIAWIIDDLSGVFRATDVAEVMKGFGKLTGRRDPFIHFYETFLAAYNPKKRKARGVWYTPEPVVNFIVRAVDTVLKTEFGLQDGLADTAKVQVDWDTGQASKNGKPIFAKKTVHQVQVLDPATGTGTFLSEVIKLVAPRVKAVAESAWSEYVEADLIPRLHGFELLMAPYAMCHLKLGLMLAELDYKPSLAQPRFSVFLTNSLEEGEPANQTLPFAQWLTNEVKEANSVKRDLPIMCIIGNPPYNPSSKNTNVWINRLMKDYKRGLGDRKINLNDDYMKFIRLSEDLISRSGAGVVAMITNNSFLDGTTQREMRRHLMNSFNSIDIYNLHGDIRDRQRNRDDENVFDITQGVCISVMRKHLDKSGARVRYAEMAGSRKVKYAALSDMQGLKETLVELSPSEPYYYFVPRVESASAPSFDLGELFIEKSSGIQTKNDEVAISWSAAERDKVVSDFEGLDIDVLEKIYPSKKVWSAVEAQKDIRSGEFERRSITYRPFDVRYTVLTRRSGGFLGRPRFNVMRHISESDISLIVNKKFVGEDFSHVSVAHSLVAHGTHYLGNRGQDIVCPLFIDADVLGAERRPNLDPKIFGKLQLLAEHEQLGAPTPIDVLDYVYGLLHSPRYRAAFHSSLKDGFPRIPWPNSAAEFWNAAGQGTLLRKLHLLEPGSVGDSDYPLIGSGDNSVSRHDFENGKIHINEFQYFDGVPDEAWNQHIGGYRPAEKWLKDRVGRKLSFEGLRHYQRIIKVLAETARILGSIDTKY